MSDRPFAGVSPPTLLATPGSLCFARRRKNAEVTSLTAGLMLRGPFRAWGADVRAATLHVLGVRSLCLFSSKSSSKGFLGGAVDKESVSAGDGRDVGSIFGLERPPAVGDGNPVQYSCLRNPMDSGA